MMTKQSGRAVGVGLCAMGIGLFISGCATVPSASDLRVSTDVPLCTARKAGIVTPGKHWFMNRVSDLMDIFCLGAGVTTVSRDSGWLPPALGVYAEATSAFQLGAITYGGATLDWEGRGLGAYTEMRTRYGIGPITAWKINQDSQFVNYYKNPKDGELWAERMKETEAARSPIADILTKSLMTRDGAYVGDPVPAKQLLHRDAKMNAVCFGRPRGWQSWGYIGGEVAVCEPFVLHHGVTVRAGVDISEIADFVFGLVGYDFLRDDRQDDE